ncbi:DUF4230 domain-containing protein [Sphingomonas koreensis]|uniref:DUF4230 domain-containing protein n=1 Tax=Sphingomonas koreensis TaxID=93064 RepID=A0A430G860_9SPHN|nr:DUF4230 domain-containing protein [Sphingomonas koreensis]RSY89701.1 DUF4230 domain-containing protein [Sphingomonas koreensis]
MADVVRREALVRGLLIAAAAAVILAAAWISWDRYAETRMATLPEEGGAPVTQIVTAKLSGTGKLQVAELSGIVQATASDIRGFGWLRSDQVVKMPYSVGYFVDLSKLRDSDLQWNAQTRTLIVDAPDVTAAPPNTDEGRRTLVETSGLFVTRDAAEALSQRTSARATDVAGREARSPERMAQAREHARRALARLLAQPLSAAGLGDVRVVVTFPPERGTQTREHWDVSRSPRQVIKDIEARDGAN